MIKSFQDSIFRASPLNGDASFLNMLLTDGWKDTPSTLHNKATRNMINGKKVKNFFNTMLKLIVDFEL